MTVRHINNRIVIERGLQTELVLSEGEAEELLEKLQQMLPAPSLDNMGWMAVGPDGKWRQCPPPDYAARMTQKWQAAENARDDKALFGEPPTSDTATTES